MTKQYNGYLFVECPEGAKSIEIWNNQLSIDMEIQATYLPPGSYTLIGRASQLTEEEWGNICEGSNENFGYKDYSGNQASHFYSTESGLSLIKHLGLKDPVIIKIN